MDRGGADRGPVVLHPDGSNTLGKFVEICNDWRRVNIDGLPSIEELDCNLPSRLREFASGSYSQVFLYKDIAAKRVEFQRGKIPTEFLNECFALCTLSHPNISSMRGLWRHGPNCFYIVMDFVPHTLMSLMPHLSITSQRVLTVHFLSALSFLQMMGIVHRDLKPCNLLVTKDGVLQVADFGHCLSIAEVAARSYQVSTKEYRAPEVILRQSYTHKVDIWAAGLVIYEMITQRMLTKRGEEDEFSTSLSGLVPVFGMPGEDEWILEGLDSRPASAPSKLRQFLDVLLVPGARELLEAMLQMNPDKRKDADELLRMEYCCVTEEDTETHSAQMPAQATQCAVTFLYSTA